MNTNGFEKTNWGWQLYLFQKQVEEWFEYQFSGFQETNPELHPGWSISPWVVELLKILFWLILGLFMVWVIRGLWQEFNPYIYSWWAKFDHASISQKKNQPDYLSISLLLNKSQEFYQQGNYREACRYLYLAMLQQLHEKAIALEQPSRTDREYLQLLTSTVTSVQPYETLIITHERLCFGNNEIFAENYHQCRQAYQEMFKS